MNQELKNHIKEYLTNGIRYDGRNLHDFRPITIDVGIIKNAEGSSRVKLGNTEVLAGVKFELSQPYPDIPDEGTIAVNAELMAISSPEFELGPPGQWAVELARVVDRGIRESKIIDTKKLCVRKGELAWMISIDICSLNDEGNLLDAASIAAIAALKNARFPSMKDEKVDYKNLTDKKLTISKTPVSVTVLKIGDKFIVDPTNEEELVIDARLTVATTEEGNICALQKGGDLQLSLDDISAMIDIALAKGNDIRKLL
jgi:exosome complex component RRP42